MDDSEVPIGNYIDSYIKLRDKADAIKKTHKEELAPYNDAMKKLEMKFQDTMNTMGLDSLKTDTGTAYQSTLVSVTVADWDGFLDYVKEHDAWFMLEKRASKTAVEEVVEDTGELPSGLNIKKTMRINVRRT